MSFQPLLFTWYSSIPRTIEADCAFVYELRADGVVHEREVHAVGVEGRPAANRLVGVPARARDDRRRAGDLRSLHRRRELRRADEVRAHARDPAQDPVPERGRRSDPHRLADTPAVVRRRVLVRRLAPRGSNVRRDRACGTRRSRARASGSPRGGTARARARAARACGWRSRCCTSPDASEEPGNASARTAATRSFRTGRPGFEGASRLPRPQGKPLLAGRIFTTVKRPFFWALLASLAAALAVPALASASAAHPRVLAIHFELEVNPVTSSYLDHELDRAQKDGYDAAVIVIDTPGGLSESMRKIVKTEIASKIPVIAYVSPNGARAASAGVWITEAADVAAMAPATNIGSSTPIDSSGQNLGSDLRRKVINDAVASLESLMRFHHRNAGLGGPSRAEGLQPRRSRCEDDERRRRARTDAAGPAEQDRRPEDRRQELHPAHRQRRDRERRAGLLHPPLERADRPEHHPAALPGRDRRDRLRDLPPGRRAARRARRDRAAHRAVRLRRAADQLGRARAPDPGRGAAGDRRPRRQPWRS